MAINLLIAKDARQNDQQPNNAGAGLAMNSDGRWSKSISI
jgi:hypothetical protein